MSGRAAIVLVALCAVLAAGCDSGDDASSTRPSLSPTAVGPVVTDKNAEKIRGFLYIASDGVMFLQWTESDTVLSGQMQVVTGTGEDSRVSEGVNRAFTGILSGSKVSISFISFGSTQTWTGALEGDRLTLVVPRDSGLLSTLVFQSATVADYNRAARTFLEGIQSAQAEATAAAAAAQDLASRQNAVADANRDLASSLPTLEADTGDLADATSFSGVLTLYADNWASMQAHDKELRADAAKVPLSCSQLRTVEGDLRTLEGDLRSTEGNRRSFDNAAEDVKAATANTENSIRSVEVAWAKLQAAVRENASGRPPAEFTQRDVDSAIEAAQNQIAASDAALQGASQQATAYAQQAEQFVQSAEAFVATLRC